MIKSGIKKASDTRSQAQRELSALAVQAGRATKEVRDQFFNDLYDQDPQPIPLDPAWWNAVVKEIQRFTLQAEQCGNIAEIASNLNQIEHLRRCLLLSNFRADQRRALKGLHIPNIEHRISDIKEVLGY